MKGIMLNGTIYDVSSDSWKCGRCKYVFTYQMISMMQGNPSMSALHRPIYRCPNVHCGIPVFEDSIVHTNLQFQKKDD